MNKIFQKFSVLLCLVTGMIFGVLFSTLTPSSPFVNSAYADELEPDNDIINPPTQPTPDTSNPSDDSNSSDPDSPDSPNADVDSDLINDSDAGNDGDDASDTDSTLKDSNVCLDQSGALGWIVCPTGGLIAKITDALYAAIGNMLTVSPISTAEDSPVYIVWQYIRNLTNIIFIIFLLIVIYSQLTGLGINNYGLKRILPRLIITVIMINLSFIICSIAVDVSNIVGASLRGFFENAQETVINNASIGSALANFSVSDLLAAVISGGTIAGVAISAVGGAGYLFFMLLVVLFGAIVSVVTGLITISARQAVVALLIMIAPLAFLAYLLPNTEKYFNQWKNLLFRMLIFYPAFSFLFGASQLIGYTLVASADSGFGLILGVAVQFFPLFASWSLMKMSGTILGSLNAGLRRLATPVHRGATGWSLSKADEHRQSYISKSPMAGARLRRFLDENKELRALNTHNSIDIRRGKAIEGALKRAASAKGYDEKGNLSWERRANRYTYNAKLASLYNTRAANAQSVYQNTLSTAGDIFKDQAITAVSDAQASAFQESMAHQFWTVNNAQADQDWLLTEYTNAIKSRHTNPYQYNRLVKSASGGIRHLGESSIMGQVIVGNSKIERRRRDEARIMITKFGADKAAVRGMSFDINDIRDDGYEYDANGNRIEDDMYNIKPGYKHTPWQKYIAVNKQTKAEITKEEYDALSDDEKLDYRKVRYCEIKDDQDNVVQTVFEDDAGYMKELLVDDIMIGDPAVNRYGTAIGVARHDGEENGVLRRYHSTITGALISTSYKDHDSAYTSMLAAHLDRGNITTAGQLNIAKLSSFNASARPNSLLISDAHAIRNYINFLNTVHNDQFAHYFPDFDLDTYDNVNNESLAGLRLALDETGNLYWQDIANNDPNLTIEDRRNKIKHGVLVKTAKKLVGTLNRQLSPGILEKQKPDTLVALLELYETLETLGLENLDPNIPFEQKLDGKTNIFDSIDPGELKKRINAGKSRIQELIETGKVYTASEDDEDDNGGDNWNDDDDNGDGNNGGPSQPPNNRNGRSNSKNHKKSGNANNYERLSSLMQQLQRHLDHLENEATLNNPEAAADYARVVTEQVNNVDTQIQLLSSYRDGITDPTIQKQYDNIIQQLSKSQDPIEVAVRAAELESAMDNYREQPATSTEQGIYNLTHDQQNTDARNAQLQNDLDQLSGQNSLFDLDQQNPFDL